LAKTRFVHFCIFDHQIPHFLQSVAAVAAWQSAQNRLLQLLTFFRRERLKIRMRLTARFFTPLVSAPLRFNK
jgi:hypothetical protein